MSWWIAAALVALPAIAYVVGYRDRAEDSDAYWHGRQDERNDNEDRLLRLAREERDMIVRGYILHVRFDEGSWFDELVD